jgi:hypothetical protein
LKKIQDRAENFSSEKSVFALLLASGSFEKIEMQELPSFKNLQFVKITSFSKLSQNFSFYSRDFRPKKKLLQIT